MTTGEKLNLATEALGKLAILTLRLNGEEFSKNLDVLVPLQRSLTKLHEELQNEFFNELENKHKES